MKLGCALLQLMKYLEKITIQFLYKSTKEYFSMPFSHVQTNPVI